jgi:hypothetical protein
VGQLSLGSAHHVRVTSRGVVCVREKGFRRELGGALFAAAGRLVRAGLIPASGLAAAAGLSAVYVAAMGGGWHPLARRIGPWPVAAVTVAAAALVTRMAPR